MLSGFELYPRWLPLTRSRVKRRKDFVNEDKNINSLE